MKAAFLLHFSACIMACLGCSMDLVHILLPNWLPDPRSICMQLKGFILGPCAQAFCLDQVSSKPNNNNMAIQFPLHFNPGWSLNVSGVEVMWFIDLMTTRKLILTICMTWWSNIQNNYWIHNLGVLNSCIYFFCTWAVHSGYSVICSSTRNSARVQQLLAGLWIVLLVIV